MVKTAFVFFSREALILHPFIRPPPEYPNPVFTHTRYDGKSFKVGE